MPINRRFVFACVALAGLAQTVLVAQTDARYRQFSLGSSLAVVAKVAEAEVSTARTIHERPAVIKEFEWRPRFQRGTGAMTDPVEVMLFRFYDDQLYMIVIDYDRRRTEGMAPTDFIDAISKLYGLPQLPSTVLGTPARPYGLSELPVAKWGDANQSVTLLRVSYPESYRLVVALSHVEDLARAAKTEATRLDAVEAPQRERERQEQADERSRTAAEKARVTNKAVFIP